MASGWSINAADLANALSQIENLSEYEVVLDDADCDHCEIAELRIERVYTPVLDHCGLIVLSQGQVISEEYDYHARMDADHMASYTKHWDDKSKTWKR